MKNRKKLTLGILAALVVVMVVVLFGPRRFDRLLSLPTDEVEYCYAILIPSFSDGSSLQVDIPVDSPEYQELLEKLDSTSYIYSGPSGNSHSITLEDYFAYLYFRKDESLFAMDFLGRYIVVDDLASSLDSIYRPLGGNDFQQEVVDYLVGCYEKYQSDS